MICPINVRPHLIQEAKMVVEKLIWMYTPTMFNPRSSNSQRLFSASSKGYKVPVLLGLFQGGIESEKETCQRTLAHTPLVMPMTFKFGRESGYSLHKKD